MGRSYPSVLLFSVLLLVVLAPFARADVEAAFDAIAAEHGGALPARVRLITDNADAWYARWYVIDHAKTSIDATYYIVDNDPFGRSFLGLLFKKAKEGVKIRLMVDARGSTALSRTFLGQDILQEMTENPNIELRVYNPIMKALLRLPEDVRNVVASNHQKLLIVDGEWLIAGGRNISQNYMLTRDDFPEAFRDTDVMIQGGSTPAAAKTAFEEEWAKPANTHIKPDAFGNWVSRRLDLELARRVMQAHIMGLAPVDGAATGLGHKLAEEQADVEGYTHLTSYAAFQPFQGEREYPVLLLGKHSLYRNTRNDVTENLERLCDAAEKEILIQNPYVVLTDGARAALKRASDRGVDIVISTNSPESSDVMLTQALFLREWKTLMRDIPRLRIHAVEGHKMLHAKVFVMDRKVAVVGSYNMDTLSEEVNAEDVALVRSAAFAGMNAHRIEEDLGGSIEYKIRVAADGSVEQVTGPSDHVQSTVMRWVETLGILAFLRPLI